MLRQLIYVSASTTRSVTPDILRIAEVARERNAAAGVTGLLVFASGAFFQVLEGADDDVEGIWRLILRDDRHRGVIKLIDHEVAARSFADWSMGWHQLEADDPAASAIRRIAGLEDVPLPDGEASAIARSLLNSFLNVNAK